MIRHPGATLEELMRIIPGPDFPAGGQIVALAAMPEIYETGRGSLKVRARGWEDRRPGARASGRPWSPSCRTASAPRR